MVKDIKNFFSDFTMTTTNSDDKNIIFKDYLKRVNKTQLQVFIEVITFWKNNPNLLEKHKKHKYSYGKLLEFLIDPEQCVITGGSVLAEKIDQVGELKEVTSSDIDFFFSVPLNFQNPKFESSQTDNHVFTKLTEIFNMDMLVKLFDDWLAAQSDQKFRKSYNKNVINRSAISRGTSSEIFQTSNEDYVSIQAQKKDTTFKTFRMPFEVFDLNFIEIQPKAIRKEATYQALFKTINKFKNLKILTAEHLYNINSNFDFENLKLVYDFQTDSIVHVTKIIYRSLTDQIKIFDDFKKEITPEAEKYFSDLIQDYSIQTKEMTSNGQPIYTVHTITLDEILAHFSSSHSLIRDKLCFKDEKLYIDSGIKNLYDFVETRPHVLLFSSFILSTINEIKQYTRSTFEKMDFILKEIKKNPETSKIEIDMKFSALLASTKISSDSADLRKTTSGRLFKYLDRGLDFEDGFGVYNILDTLDEQQQFIKDKIKTFRVLARKNIIKNTLGARHQQQYSIAAFEQHHKYKNEKTATRIEPVVAVPKI